jgi:urease accessory protein
MQQHARRLLGLAMACMPLTAFAHTGEHTSSFFAGLAHPLTGLDHLLAMLAVGMLASRLPGAKRWTLPASFIAAMIVGCLVAAIGIALPFVEGLIAVSLLAFGALLLSNRPLSAPMGAALVALFGVFHGHAHGSETIGPSLMTFGIGFILATAALHGAGLFATLRIEAWTQRVRGFLRVSGGAIAFTGALLVMRLT